MRPICFHHGLSAIRTLVRKRLPQYKTKPLTIAAENDYLLMKDLHQCSDLKAVVTLRSIIRVREDW